MKKYKKSDPVYHTGTWDLLRVQVRERQKGMCADCMRLFEMGVKIRPARIQMVHHIIPVRERRDLAYNLDNLVGLCYSCHEFRERRSSRHEKGEGESPAEGMRVIRI